MEINDITSRVLGAAVEVQIPLIYDGRKLETGYRLDFLVEDQVVVEVKAVQKLEPVFVAQTLTYLRVGGYPVGLLINFNVPYLGDGAIRRLVNRYQGPRPQESG